MVVKTRVPQPEARQTGAPVDRSEVAATLSIPAKKKPVAWIVLAGILALAVVAGFAFWLGGREGGISSAEQRQNEERIKSQIGEEEWQRVKREGPGLADKLLKDEKSVAPVAPAIAPVAPAITAKDEGWTKTFQTRYGPIEVKYIRTNSAKGKVAVWMNLDERGELYRNIQNISDKPIEGRWTFVETDMSGEKWEPTVLTRQLKPGQIETDWVGVARDDKSIETYFEVTNE